jgi:hypothetical protein
MKNLFDKIIIELLMVIGYKNDENDNRSIFFRDKYQIFIGKRGGLSTYIGGKRITGRKTINHYNR